jgi:hypothetical protein
MCAPSLRGGGERATCRQGQALARDGAYSLKKMCPARRAEMEAWDEDHCTWDVENDDRT